MRYVNAMGYSFFPSSISEIESMLFIERVQREREREFRESSERESSERVQREFRESSERVRLLSSLLYSLTSTSRCIAFHCFSGALH
jgi:hypothetical protein